MNVFKFIGLTVIETATLIAQAPCAIGEVLCIGGRDISKGVKKAAEFSETQFEKGRSQCESGRKWIRTESEFNKLLLQLKIAQTPEQVFAIISEEEVAKIMSTPEAELSKHDSKLKSTLIAKTQKFVQATQPA